MRNLASRLARLERDRTAALVDPEALCPYAWTTRFIRYSPDHAALMERVDACLQSEGIPPRAKRQGDHLGHDVNALVIPAAILGDGSDPGPEDRTPSQRDALVLLESVLDGIGRYQIE